MPKLTYDISNPRNAIKFHENSPVGTNSNTPRIVTRNVSEYEKKFFQITSKPQSGTIKGTVKFYGSNDGTNFDQIGESITLEQVSSNAIINTFVRINDLWGYIKIEIINTDIEPASKWFETNVTMIGR